MLKKLEVLASAILFLLMFVFISQLEMSILPFGIAFCGVISCGGLSIILLMHGADLSFTLDLAENDQSPDTKPCYVAETTYPALSADLPSSWLGKTNAA